MGFISEALIALVEKDRQRPCYSERAMDRRIEKANRREPVAATLSRDDGRDILLQSEIDAIFAVAKLTERQERVFRLRLNGLTFEEIGQGARHSKQGAQRIFIRALKKIACAYRVYPFVGLSEVYRRETQRGLRTGSSGTMRH